MVGDENLEYLKRNFIDIYGGVALQVNVEKPELLLVSNNTVSNQPTIREKIIRGRKKYEIWVAYLGKTVIMKMKLFAE